VTCEKRRKRTQATTRSSPSSPQKYLAQPCNERVPAPHTLPIRECAKNMHASARRFAVQACVRDVRSPPRPIGPLPRRKNSPHTSKSTLSSFGANCKPRLKTLTSLTLSPLQPKTFRLLVLPHHLITTHEQIAAKYLALLKPNVLEWRGELFRGERARARTAYGGMNVRELRRPLWSWLVGWS